MTDSQVAELRETMTNSLKSNTIEWAMNLRICDLLQSNPSLTPVVMSQFTPALRRSSPVRVLLALSLLEMVVKNCGITACSYIDNALAAELVLIVKRREGAWYSMGRNLHKSVGSWMPTAGIGESDRKLWIQASEKTLEMLQLWAEAFMLQQNRLRPVFDSYKQLRAEGYKFPKHASAGTSSDLVLISGANESPLFPPCADHPAVEVSGATGETVVREDVRATSHFQSRLEDAHAALGCILAEGGGGEIERALAAQAWAMQMVDQQMVDGQLGEDEFRDLLALVDDLGHALAHQEVNSQPDPHPLSSPTIASEAAHEAPLIDMGEDSSAGDNAPGTLPPPPSEAPPSKEDQERYDLMFARYLQEQENANYMASMEEDAALALRLSMQDGPGLLSGTSSSTRPLQRNDTLWIGCARCAALNQVHGASPQRSELFSCWGCGQVQRVPASQISVAAATSHSRSHPSDVSGGSPEMRPTRHAPAPHVMRAGGEGPELLITSGRDNIRESGFGADEATPSGQGSKALSFEGGASESLSGSGYSKKLTKAVQSLMPATSGRHGVPRGEYMELGDSADSALLQGGAPPPSSGRGFGSMLSWRSKQSTGEMKQSLLERVRVDDDWELIRKPGEQPYWHNHATGRSQWEPPDVVRGEDWS